MKEKYAKQRLDAKEMTYALLFSSYKGTPQHLTASSINHT